MPYPETPAKMPSELQPMYDSFMAALNDIKESGAPLIDRAERSVAVAKNVIRQLKSYVEKKPFSTKEAEIEFFKFIKPAFYCQLLLYQHLYVMEGAKPSGGQKSVRKYFKKKLRTLKDYFEENQDLYLYLRRRSNYLDEIYFVRMKEISGLPVEAVNIDGDPEFSTPLDHRVSEILKNELLQKYLEEALVTTMPYPGAPSTGDTDLQWTGTLNALYQLIYSLVRSGAINNGNITISQFAEKCERLFNVNLKNIYRGMQENRIKRDRAAFLKSLVKVLEEDMDNSDEHPRY